MAATSTTTVSGVVFGTGIGCAAMFTWDPVVFNGAVIYAMASFSGAAILGWLRSISRFVRENLLPIVGAAAPVFFRERTLPPLLALLGVAWSVLGIMSGLTPPNPEVMASALDRDAPAAVMFRIGVPISVLLMWFGIPLSRQSQRLVKGRRIAAVILFVLALVLMALAWCGAFSLWGVV